MYDGITWRREWPLPLLFSFVDYLHGKESIQTKYTELTKGGHKPIIGS